LPSRHDRACHPERSACCGSDLADGQEFIANSDVAAANIYNLVQLAVTRDTTASISTTKSLPPPTGTPIVFEEAMTLSAQHGAPVKLGDAFDDVGVVRVEFYVNGAPLSTDATAPYVAYWNTRQAQDGANTISAVAYDARGNSSVAAVTAYR
jgi:Big-like domain-containing protein